MRDRIKKSGAAAVFVCLSAVFMIGSAAAVPMVGAPVLLKSGDYEMYVSPAQAWTPYSIRYDGTVVGQSNGFYGTVFCESSNDWIGSGHHQGGDEIVNSLLVTVDGAAMGEPVPGQTYSGTNVTLTKWSQIGKLNEEFVINITSNRIHEAMTLTAVSDQFIHTLYVFMHPFTTNTTKWIAEAGSTTYQGELLSDTDFELSQAVDWVALYSPGDQVGMMVSYPELYPVGGVKNGIWDLPAYHKLYYQPFADQLFAAGQLRSWEMELRCFPAATDSEWLARVWELNNTNGIRECYWDGGGADQNWSTPMNWYHVAVDNTEPDANDHAFIGTLGRAPSATAVVDRTGEVSDQVFLGYDAGTEGTLRVLNGELDVFGGLRVGYRGNGTLALSDGVVRVTNQCTVGVLSTGVGQCNVTNGSLLADKLVVGDQGSGEVHQSGGAVTVSQQMLIGGTSGTGTYRLDSGTLSSLGAAQVGDRSAGAFVQTGGLLDMSGKTLSVGYNTGSTGTYSLAGGQLQCGFLYLGHLGQSRGGTFVQTGGTNAVQSGLILGRYTPTKGTYNLFNGVLLLDGSSKYITIGYGGNGNFNLGTTNSAGKIQETGTGSYLEVRKEATAAGVLQGWGSVALSGYVRNSGQIIANGYGADRDLDLSSLSTVATNSFANTTSNGWFAVNHGRLILPDLWLGTGAFYWGENANLDLVNSVRFDLTGASGQLFGKLVAPDHGSVPGGLLNPVSVWEFNAAVPGSGTLTFRYDDARNIPADQLMVMHYDGSQWQNVTGTRNEASKTLTTQSGMAPVGFFAVSQRSLSSGLLFSLQ